MTSFELNIYEYTFYALSDTTWFCRIYQNSIHLIRHLILSPIAKGGPDPTATEAFEDSKIHVLRFGMNFGMEE